MAEETEKKEVNSIEVKSETYQIADKKMRDLVDNLVSGVATSPNFVSTLPYSDRTTLKPTTIASVLSLTSNYGICYTEANNQFKSITISGLPDLVSGLVTIAVTFINGNTADDIELNVNNMGSFPIIAENSTKRLGTGSINANGTLILRFISKQWIASTPLVRKTSMGPEFVWD